MSNIEIGEYVRTKDGCIAQVVNINDYREPSMKYGVEANYLQDIAFIGDEVITKQSKNIIDLIEVGDIVELEDTTKNIFRVLRKRIYWIDDEISKQRIFEDKYFKLKSILTHEQYNQNCYRLEE